MQDIFTHVAVHPRSHVAPRMMRSGLSWYLRQCMLMSSSAVCHTCKISKHMGVSSGHKAPCVWSLPFFVIPPLHASWYPSEGEQCQVLLVLLLLHVRPLPLLLLCHG
jgi:hypothetical protein